MTKNNTAAPTATELAALPRRSSSPADAAPRPPPSPPKEEDVEGVAVIPRRRRRRRRRAPRLPPVCIIDVDGRRGGEMVALPSPRSSCRAGDDVGESGGRGENDDDCGRGGRVDSSSSRLVQRWSTEKNREREARQP
jgi:hypothetical protein